MATPASASPLPFLETLAKSRHRADRALWLRIVLDGLRQPETARASFGPDLARDFAHAMTDLDPASQMAVVHRLCALREVPRALWDAILDLGGEPRRLAISRAGVLRRDMLISALDEPALSPAVASRPDLDGEMVDRILQKSHYPTLVALAGNALAKLESAQVVKLAEIARDEGAGSMLAAALLERSPVGASSAPLFLQATSPQRVQILLALQRLELGRPAIAAAGPAPGDRLAQLEQLALDGSRSAFARALGELLMCDEVLADRIASDPYGEPLAAVLAAHGAPADVSVRILTARDLSDGADKYRRLGSLVRLRDALSPAVARKVVAAMVGHELRPIQRPAASAPTRSRAPETGARPAPMMERPLPLADSGSPSVVRRGGTDRRFAG